MTSQININSMIKIYKDLNIKDYNRSMNLRFRGNLNIF